MKRFYFIGIGGSGMSSLAQILSRRGNWVGGSDRSFDRKTNRSFFNKLHRQGIHLSSQEESSISPNLDCVVVSTAIEESNRQLKKARFFKIPVVHRAELLADLFNASCGIGIAGTSGKSTVTGMVASILEKAGKDPTVINGGIVKSYVSKNLVGNAKNGGSDLMVAEVDESDGSVIHFLPEIGLVSNISKDHKEIGELQDLFQTFADHTKKMLILNGDCVNSAKIRSDNIITFGFKEGNAVRAEKIERYALETRFRVGATIFKLNVPGEHNISNALAAVAVGTALGLHIDTIRRGLATFKGIKRRLDLVGRRNGITVIDDFAHNPDKIMASIEALRPMGKRLLVLFQPHGYGPTRFLRRELGNAFGSSLKSHDYFICLNIYDAGGTADRSVCSADLVGEVHGPHLANAGERKEALALVKQQARPGDVIAVMGARDDTLSTFARKILREIA